MTFIFSKDNTIILSSADGIQKGTYTLVGKSLIIDWGEGASKATIKELTKNSLIFRVEMGGGAYLEFTCQRITDDPTKTEEPTIVGEWKVLFQDMGDGEIYPGQGMTFIFSKDNTVILSFADGIQKGTYTLIGKNLIFDWGDGPTKATIKELTKDSLILRVEMGGGEYLEFTCQRVS